MTTSPFPARTPGAAIKTDPDHHDAELLLRLYDLRREPLMRDARRYMTAEFWPADAATVLAHVRPEHPHNAAYRQVTTYWEMAYGMARHGIINPDYLAEFASEGLFIFAKLEAWLAPLREATHPRVLRNTEWLAGSCETARDVMATTRKRVAAALAARAPRG